MNDLELYEFDRQGYIVIKNLLSPEVVKDMHTVVDKLEAHAAEHVILASAEKSWCGQEFHRNEELGYHVTGGTNTGQTLVVEDFFNTNPGFDCLIEHPETMAIFVRLFKVR